MIQLSERTLGDWLEHWAKETPDKEYIVYSDRNLRLHGVSSTDVWTIWLRDCLPSVSHTAHTWYMGEKRTRLADVSLCLCQNWCCSSYG